MYIYICIYITHIGLVAPRRGAGHARRRSARGRPPPARRCDLGGVLDVYTYVCMCVCVYIYIYIYNVSLFIYIHITSYIREVNIKNKYY